MITGYGLASILGKAVQTPDSGAAATPGAPDAAFATYLGNPPDPIPVEIPKSDFDSVFTAMGGSQAQADAVFAQLDKDGDGTLDQGDLLAKGGQSPPALTAAQPYDPSVAAPNAGFAPVEDPATALLWTGGIAHADPAGVSPGGQPSPTPPGAGDMPASPVWSGPTGGLAWMSPEGMGVLLHAQAAQDAPASYAGNPPPPVSFEITKTNFETVYTAFGGSLDQADLLFAKLDQDGDGTLDQGDLLSGAKNAPPALTATNSPAGPAGLAGPGAPGNELGLQTLLTNPPPFTVR
jgi:hypothetical protein